MNLNTLIVVVSYNSESFIENCLRSISEQTYKKWFLVVVDNNSSDTTVNKVKEFKNNCPFISSENFKFIPLKKNLGFAGGVNYAVFKFASSEKQLNENFKYLILVNPDLSLEKDALENLILPFEISQPGEKNYSCSSSMVGYSIKEEEIGVVGGLILDYEKDIVQHLGGSVSKNFITSHIGYGKKYELKRKLTRINKEQYLELLMKSILESGLFDELEKQDVLGRLEFSQKKEFQKSRENYLSGISGKRNLIEVLIKLLIEVDYVTGALFSTPYRLFKKLGGFDKGYRPAYFEEVDYCMKIRYIGKKVVVNPFSIGRHFEGASVGKFTRKFYWYYHKNRIRCALISMSFVDFFLRFIKEELKWIKVKATKDQYIPLLYSYFINFLFLPYSLAMKLKNYLMLSRLRVK